MMKAIARKLALGACLISFAASAQQVETDDLYFNSKDRAALNDKQASAALARLRQTEEVDLQNRQFNPTESYSARNVNPEYSATGPGQSEAADEGYFLPNYQPTGVNQNLYSSYPSNPNYGGYNAWNQGPMNGWGYGPNRFYPSFWSDPFWGSPYYSSCCNPYRSFYNPGLSLSLGYAWGSWNSWYSGLGYGLGWNAWNPYYGWGGYYGYPSQLIVINSGSEGRTIAYGKRPARSSNLSHTVDRSRSSATPVRNNQVSSGRTRSEVSYYDRSWKRNSGSATRSFWSTPTAGQATQSSRPVRNFSTWTNDANWNSGSGTGRQRTSSFSSPTRSSGGAPSGGSRSSSGGTRGRNN